MNTIKTKNRKAFSDTPMGIKNKKDKRIVDRMKNLSQSIIIYINNSYPFSRGEFVF
jgi:hypothetical protein